jgi:hypothetical protein
MSAFDAPGTHGVRESLAMDIEEFRRLGHRIVDLAASFLAGLPERPVFRPMKTRASSARLR